ncbi:MAG: hypothetical protein J0I41_03040 [Filimonas sp.]|nr:hypothetical protein [Filimonas sp.]
MQDNFNFVVTIKNNRYRVYDRISMLMLLLSVVAFAYASFQPISTKLKLFYAGATIVVLFSWYIVILLAKRNNAPVAFRPVLFAAGLAWFIPPYGNFLIAGLFLLAGLIEKQVKFAQEMGVDEDGITFNSFPKFRFHAWTELNNVILKDGLLTVDYKNNKVFQKEIHETPTNLEKEFNDFCAAQLKKA